MLTIELASAAQSSCFFLQAAGTITDYRLPLEQSPLLILVLINMLLTITLIINLIINFQIIRYYLILLLHILSHFLNFSLSVRGSDWTGYRTGLD
jgi:hypothetical protein